MAPRPKLSEADVKRIRRRVRAGEHQIDIAPEFGVNRKTIGRRLAALQRAETECGLAPRRFIRARLDAEVDTLTQELARKSPIGMKLGLEAFYKMQDMSFPSAMAYLQDQLALLSLSDDLKEGVTAFFEKRTPRFTGR